MQQIQLSLVVPVNIQGMEKKYVRVWELQRNIEILFEVLVYHMLDHVLTNLHILQIIIVIHVERELIFSLVLQKDVKIMRVHYDIKNIHGAVQIQDESFHHKGLLKNV